MFSTNFNSIPAIWWLIDLNIPRLCCLKICSSSRSYLLSQKVGIPRRRNNGPISIHRNSFLHTSNQYLFYMSGYLIDIAYLFAFFANQMFFFTLIIFYLLKLYTCKVIFMKSFFYLKSYVTKIYEACLYKILRKLSRQIQKQNMRIKRSKLMMIMIFVDGGSLGANIRYYSIFNAWSPYRYLYKQTNTLQRGICFILLIRTL